MWKHKQVTCQICFKPIRSDTLKRHRKVHLKYSIESSLSTEDTCRDLVLEIVDQVADPKDVSSGIKRKHEEVEYEAQTTFDEEALEKSALKINNQYEEKIGLGKALYKILNKGVVQEESFPSDWKNALDSYLKQGHQIDYAGVILEHDDDE